MIIVANWKAYVPEVSRAKKLFALAKRLATSSKVTIVLAPSAPFLGLLAAGNRSKVAFAAQDISSRTDGAMTGESVAAVFASAGATYTILGHSERRALGESDALIAEKVQRALAQGLTPILCVGEKERDASAEYLSGLRAQIGTALALLTPKERLGVIIAYEPVWAIGKSAAEAISATDLTEMVLYIRKVLGEYVPHKAPSRIPVLYGGSVDPVNVRELAAAAQVDGFLVGRASVDPVSFAGLVKALRA